jgi:hypothetical protein
LNFCPVHYQRMASGRNASVDGFCRSNAKAGESR